MGWRSREFLCLSLCEEGGTTFGCPDLGDLSRLAVDLCYLAICIVVRADGGGHSEYIQEVPLKNSSGREQPDRIRLCEVHNNLKMFRIPGVKAHCIRNVLFLECLPWEY